jgi:hypothetical protein
MATFFEVSCRIYFSIAEYSKEKWGRNIFYSPGRKWIYGYFYQKYWQLFNNKRKYFCGRPCFKQFIYIYI